MVACIDIVYKDYIGTSSASKAGTYNSWTAQPTSFDFVACDECDNIPGFVHSIVLVRHRQDL